MDSKLQELTEKIYREGVEKGEQQAQQILEAARKQAADIVGAAHQEAESIIAGAQKRGDELRRTIEADMRLSCSQAVQALRQQVIDALVLSAVEKPVSAALSNPETITDLLKTIVQSWKPGSGEAPSLAVLLPESRRAELELALKSGLQDQLSKGLFLQFTKNIKAGFQIQPEGAAYKISFAEDDFTEFLKEYLRPKTRDFLFGQ